MHAREYNERIQERSDFDGEIHSRSIREENIRQVFESPILIRRPLERVMVE